MVVLEGGDLYCKAYFRTVTYSLEQLTRGCVDETPMRAYTSTYLRRMTITCGSVEYNELNRCLIGYRGNCASYISDYQQCVDINEQLSLKNALNALCYQSNCMNCFFPRICVCMSGNWT